MSTKNQSTTLIERFGFSDADLKKPLHDQIMKWLDRNIDDVVCDIAAGQGWVSKRNRWDTEIIEDLRNAARRYVTDAISRTRLRIKELEARIAAEENEAKNRSHDLLPYRLDRLEESRKEISRCAGVLQSLESWDGLGEPPEYRAMEITRKTWEQPITSGRFIVGFLDMYVEASTVEISFNGHPGHSIADSGTELQEVPCWTLSHLQTFHFSFEVKTTIPNLGELLRQIRLYQQYTRPETRYVVVSPDDSDSTLIKDQGILFYKCSVFSQNQRQQTLFD